MRTSLEAGGKHVGSLARLVGIHMLSKSRIENWKLETGPRMVEEKGYV